MNVFLTGGTGFIGQPLARALVARGWQVNALVRRPNSSQARALAVIGATCIVGDVTDRESMRSGIAGADLVVHNAGWYEVGVHQKARDLMYSINVTGTENVLSLALEYGVPRNVHVSSIMYYGATGPELRDETYRRQHPYNSYYEQSKAEAHKLAESYLQRGLLLMIACPLSVTGPNDHSVWGYFLRLYLNRMMPPCAWAPEVINTNAHVEDIAEGIALIAEKGRSGESYLLAGDPVRMRDIMNLWATRPGGLKVRFYMPSGLAAIMFAPLEPLQRMAGLPAFISRETVNTTRSYHFSNAKARRELGWTYRPTVAMWHEIIDQELALLAGRKKRDIVSLLRPIEE